jgi:hypothetical protein
MFYPRAANFNKGQGKYCSQSCGQRSRRRVAADNFFGHVQKARNGCIIWTARTQKDGYGVFHDETGQTVLAHRYAYALMIGEVPLGRCVLHRCDNPPCVNPVHLWTGTNHDNVIDSCRKGRRRRARGRMSLIVINLEG